MIEQNVSTLKIHRLTQEQYDREFAAGRIDENAIYLTPEEELDLSDYATVDQLKNKVDKVDGKDLSTNDYTTAEKNKLANIEEGAQVNQNAFSEIYVNGYSKPAITPNSSIEVKPGVGISVGAEAGNNATYDLKISNTGVLEIASGTVNGTISVTKHNTTTNVAVKGLGSAAYTAASAYDTAGAADEALESAKEYTNTSIANLVNSAPEGLNTLNELATALGGDPNFATTITTEIGKKIDKIDGKGLSTNDFTDEYKEKLDTFEETDPTVPAWAKEANKPTYTASEVGALPADTVIPTVPTKVSAFTNDAGYLTQHQSLAGYATETYANTAVSNHNINNSAHNDIRLLIEGLTNRLNTLADSDDTTLDQMSEIVAYIKSNKSLIEDITTNKVNVTDIINNLTTNVTNKPLSAAQGVAIKGLIDALQEELDTHTHSISEVSGLQSALDGKAPSSHGTHVSYSSTAPVMDGTASAGSASAVARSDHKHPTDTSRASKSEFNTHTGNTTVHITSTERTNWNAAYTHSQAAHAPSNAQPNQNAFSNVKVGSTTIAADSTTDTLTLVGSNVTITPDATNDKVTIGITKDNVTSALGYTPPTTNTTYSNATTSAAGLMSASDKSKLDGIASGANKITVDSSMSSTSTNPVQNKVVYTAINNIKGVPACTTSNNGQFLRVVNGVAAWSTVPKAEEATF